MQLYAIFVGFGYFITELYIEENIHCILYNHIITNHYFWKKMDQHFVILDQHCYH